MSQFSELSKDAEFRQRWPYIWSKLEPHLLAKQRQFAAQHKGDYEEVGRFVTFMSELMDDFNSIDISVSAPTPPKRKMLHNRDFEQK